MHSIFRGKLDLSAPLTETSMTLDHDGNPIHLPITLNTENEMSVRETFGKIADFIVSYSQLQAQYSGLEAQFKAIHTQIKAAEEMAAQAIRERDEALTRRDEAIEREQIARAAYATVNDQKTLAETRLASVDAQVALLNSDLALAKQYLDFRADELTRVNSLLDIAQRDRETWRDKWDSERDRADLNQMQIEDMTKEIAGRKENQETLGRHLEEERNKVVTVAIDRDHWKTLANEGKAAQDRIPLLELANLELAKDVVDLKQKVDNARLALS